MVAKAEYRDDILYVTAPYIGACLSVNHYKYRGGKRTRNETLQWMQELACAVRPYSTLFHTNRAVRIVLWGHFRDNRRPDLANLYKVIGDALQDGLGVNDKLFQFEDGGIIIGATAPQLKLDIEQIGEE